MSFPSAYLEQLYSLKNKVALVIGGGGHLCSAMAESLSMAGATIIVADLRLHKAAQVSDHICSLSNFSVTPLKLDATVLADHQSALDFIVSNYGQLDILINGAGINSSTPFFEINEDEWHRVFDSQLTATMLGCQTFGRHMVSNNKGCIVNISSASAGPPLSKAFAYSAAKSGIVNLTKNLAREFAVSSVRVNSIRPGFFPTKWNIENFIDDDRERSIFSHTPMMRYGLPDELVSALIWLCSDSSSFVTGADIAVDGGFSCMTI